MKKNYNRRNFIKASVAAGVGVGLSIGPNTLLARQGQPANGKRVGIIGLDTSHSTAFTKTLNKPDAGPEFGGYRVVAAYPKGSNDIESSVKRIPGYIEDVKKQGVKIVSSIKELLSEVDVVLLETNDGRLHLQQALEVFKAGKPVFIDKPIAASLADVIDIFEAAARYKVPVFTSSSLRYKKDVQAIAKGKVGNVLGADAFSPAHLEKTHPDFFWYGVHGVEILYTVMGTGCKSVIRTHTADTDVVVGKWADDRIGTFRGVRKGKLGYGGTAFGDKGIATMNDESGYDVLLEEIVKFFQTGTAPVSASETIELFAFMEAADESRRQGGKSVSLESVMQKARIARR